MNTAADSVILASVLSPVDYVVIATYMAAVMILGSLIGRGQKSTTSYLLAGRKMNWVVVCVSIIATDLSASTYMGVPGWLYTKDLKYFLGITFTPLSMLLVVVVFARTYHRLKVFTVYEYLEYRFHPFARTVISVLFLFQRGVWLAAVIYIPSLAVVTAAGLPLGTATSLTLVGCIVAIGLVTTIYTFVGGMKAVLWTDFVQFIVLIGGLLGMIGILLASFNWDLPSVWARAGALTASETQTPHTTLVDWSFDFKTEAAVWVLFLHFVIYQMGTLGADQVVAQRYFTLDSFRKIAQSALGAGFLMVGTVYALALFGLLLVVHYNEHPELAATLVRPDQILPHFAVHVLPHGVRGLIIAAILAATMSSVSSGLNSFAAVGVMDLYKRHFDRARHMSERGLLTLARAITFVCGVLVTLVAIWISRKETNIVETVAALQSKFIGPITGIFFLGILTRRANTTGVVVGALAGLVVAFLFDVAPMKENVNWMWTAPMTCLTTFAVGYAVSLAAPGGGRPSRQVSEDSGHHHADA